MKIIRGSGTDRPERPAVSTLGVFDGLHLGHQQIVRTVVARAAAIGAVPTVVTFDPHPRSIIRPETAPPLLQTFAQKMEGLRILGIQQVLVLEFTPELALLAAEEFIERYLSGLLESREVYLGEGFAFGHDRRGTIELLRTESRRLGFLAGEVPEVQLRGHRISSTLIRQLLQSGRVNLARRMLGRPYGIEGVVTRGLGLGSRLLYPTANLAVDNRVIPAEGVYVTLSLVEGAWHRSVTNVGKRPTVSDDGISKIEAHLIDFDRDIYDQNVRLRFLHRIRGEQKFSGLEELKARITYDRDLAIRYFDRGPIRRNLGFVQIAPT
ncbi:MAG: bifunctional riboflavin kinase/FAD synthetase [Acidobacteria bacterium]|nr:bifunctional riboflavin kinase/FAD synthetase [Acidobacteriota bacterium]